MKKLIEKYPWVVIAVALFLGVFGTSFYFQQPSPEEIRIEENAYMKDITLAFNDLNTELGYAIYLRDYIDFEDSSWVNDMTSLMLSTVTYAENFSTIKTPKRFQSAHRDFLAKGINPDILPRMAPL